MLLKQLAHPLLHREVAVLLHLSGVEISCINVSFQKMSAWEVGKLNYKVCEYLYLILDRVNRHLFKLVKHLFIVPLRGIYRVHPVAMVLVLVLVLLYFCASCYFFFFPCCACWHIPCCVFILVCADFGPMIFFVHKLNICHPMPDIFHSGGSLCIFYNAGIALHLFLAFSIRLVQLTHMVYGNFMCPVTVYSFLQC